jgi:hypothetical protein
MENYLVVTMIELKNCRVGVIQQYLTLSDLIQCMKIYSSTVKFNTMYEDLLLRYQIYYSTVKFNTMYEDLLLHSQIYYNV